MKKGRIAALAAAAFLLLVVIGALAGGRQAAGPSALSASPSGWSAFRRYVELRGSKTELLDRPFSQKREGALLIAFPEKGSRSDEEVEAVRSFVAKGGTLLLAFSGELRQPEEARVLASFGMSEKQVRGDLPLAPREWYRFQTETWRLTPDPAADPEAGFEVEVHAPRSIPIPPSGAKVLFRKGDVPMIFTFPRGRGRVLALPADTLSNGRLSAAGNADLAELLAGRLGTLLLFDEHFHGLSSPDAEGAGPSFPFDLLAAQLLLLYALAAVALGRRFGAAWKETPVRTGSTSTFLLGLASRHRRFGHYAEAAELLVRRARAYDPALALPPDAAALGRQGTEESLLALGREIGRIQADKGAAR